MKKLIACSIAAVVLALGACSAIAAPSTKQASKAPAQWMYTISAKSAHIQYVKKGRYLLEVSLPDNNTRAVLFTTKSARTVKVIGAKQLKKKWSKRKMSTYKPTDPPNATLSATNLRPVVVEILQITIKGSKASLLITPLKHNKARLPKINTQLSNLVLTVDSTGKIIYKTTAACEAACCGDGACLPGGGSACEWLLSDKGYVCDFNT